MDRLQVPSTGIPALKAPGLAMRFKLHRGLQPVDIARDHVRDALVLWEMDRLVDDAKVIVSELVTNAIVHVPTASDYFLCISRDGGYPLIEVWDPSTAQPVIFTAHDTQVRRRGLLIVRELAAHIGLRTMPPAQGGGKIVWALRRDPNLKNEGGSSR